MSRPTRIDNKIAAIVYQIKRLNTTELQLLAAELRKLGFPPGESTQVGARPCQPAPALSGVAAEPWPGKRAGSDGRCRRPSL